MAMSKEVHGETQSQVSAGIRIFDGKPSRQVATPAPTCQASGSETWHPLSVWREDEIELREKKKEKANYVVC